MNEDPDYIRQFSENEIRTIIRDEIKKNMKVIRHAGKRDD